jgi:hypothetical protein
MRRSKTFALFLLTMPAVLAVWPSSAAAVDYDCSDFATRKKLRNTYFLEIPTALTRTMTESLARTSHRAAGKQKETAVGLQASPLPHQNSARMLPRVLHGTLPALSSDTAIDWIPPRSRAVIARPYSTSTAISSGGVRQANSEPSAGSRFRLKASTKTRQPASGMLSVELNN